MGRPRGHAHLALARSALRARSARPVADRGAYARVGEAFRERFGPHAGWAQQTLFYRAAVARD
jgi:3-methyladenine DNA glycosylase/8-oxoguanine DNA glycosylase